MSNLHAHIESYTTDCDGPLSRDYVLTMNDEERAEATAANGINDFSDIHFHERVVNHLVNTYSIFQSGRLEVTSGEGSDYVVRMEWQEDTDEGYRQMSAIICEDENCDTGEAHYRDHRAEEMGY